MRERDRKQRELTRGHTEEIHYEGTSRELSRGNMEGTQNGEYLYSLILLSVSFMVFMRKYILIPQYFKCSTS